MAIFYLLLFIVGFLVNALHIKGLNTITYYEENNDESKMVLWKVREWVVNVFGEFWAKPIVTCPPCMSSLHTTYIFFPVATTVYGLDFGWALVFWPIYALAMAGFQKFIND